MSSARYEDGTEEEVPERGVGDVSAGASHVEADAVASEDLFDRSQSSN